MGAFLGPLLGLAGGLGNALLGKLGGGANPFSGLSPGVSNASKSILGNIPTQIAKGNAAMDEGLESLNSSANFFKTILGGSSEATQKLLAPQVNTVLKQYDNAAKVAANLGPRSGGSAGSLAETQAGKAGAYSGLLSGALPGAAEGLTNIAKTQAGVGTTLTGQSNEAIAPILRQQDQAAAITAQNMSGLGAGLGKWLAGLLSNKSKYDPNLTVLNAPPPDIPITGGIPG